MEFPCDRISVIILKVEWGRVLEPEFLLSLLNLQLLQDLPGHAVPLLIHGLYKAVRKVGLGFTIVILLLKEKFLTTTTSVAMQLVSGL